MSHKELLIQARDALDEASTGLEWFRDSHPEDVDGSDDEADGRIKEALAVLQAAIDAPEPDRVFLVATGDIHDGQETYTRHDIRPPLCDAEVLYAAPAKPLTDEQIDFIANDGRRNAAGGISATRVYEFAQAIESAHGITKDPS